VSTLLSDPEICPAVPENSAASLHRKEVSLASQICKKITSPEFGVFSATSASSCLPAVDDDIYTCGKFLYSSSW
jgi:hypothetical protein